MNQIYKARQLRCNQTDVEKLLWKHIRNRQLNGFKFRRQYVIGVYIVDFICIQQRLIIELDGGQHMIQKQYDENRITYLIQQGYSLIRFWNNDVLNNLTGVLETLTLTLSQRERG